MMKHSSIITCVMCKIDVKVDVDENNLMQQISEIGYCLQCELKCKSCEQNLADKSNKLNLCIGCYKEYSEYQEDFVDESEVAVKELLLELVDKICESGSSHELAENNSNEYDNYYIDNQVIQDLSIDVEELDLGQEHVPPADHDQPSIIEIGSETYLQDISKVFHQSIAGLGSDSYFGSTNGELTDASCKKLNAALSINPNDSVCDIGSGSGFTIMRIVAISNCKFGIGIEVHVQRHNIAVNFNKMLMEKYFNYNFPVAFINEDVTSNFFSNLDGITKIIMYDKVFNVDVLSKIATICNSSKTIMFIASTKSCLEEYGFQVELFSSVGSLRARGGETSHNWYIYKCVNYVNDVSLLTLEGDSKLSEAFKRAADRQIRYTESVKYMHSVHNSEKSPREPTVQRILGESRNSDLDSSTILYNMMRGQKHISINGVEYKANAPATRDYELFNKVSLINSYEEYGAVVARSKKKALICPAYNANESHPKILIAVLYDPTKSNGVYLGVVYYNETNTFHNEPINKLYEKFDYRNSIPFDMTNILKDFRIKYPKNTESDLVLGKRKVVTESRREEFLSRSPILDSNNRKRQLTVRNPTVENQAKNKVMLNLERNLKKKQKVIDDLTAKLLLSQESLKESQKLLTTSSKLKPAAVMYENSGTSSIKMIEAGRAKDQEICELKVSNAVLQSRQEDSKLISDLKVANEVFKARENESVINAETVQENSRLKVEAAVYKERSDGNTRELDNFRAYTKEQEELKEKMMNTLVQAMLTMHKTTMESNNK